MTYSVFYKKKNGIAAEEDDFRCDPVGKNDCFVIKNIRCQKASGSGSQGSGEQPGRLLPV